MSSSDEKPSLHTIYHELITLHQQIGIYYNISGSIWPTGFGRICGINPDQHFYVHIRKEENFKHIDISITTVRINKSYKFGKRLFPQFSGRGYESKMIYY